jgi:hypothetical protein
MLTTQQAAARLGISTGRVRQLAALGYGQRFGRDWMFTEDDIRSMAARNTAVGRPRKDAGR